MTLTELVEQVADDLGMHQEEVWQVCSKLVEAMAATLARGEELKIRGFGSFVWKRLESTRRRIPGTNRLVHVPAKLVLRFRPSDKTNPKREIKDG